MVYLIAIELNFLGATHKRNGSGARDDIEMVFFLSGGVWETSFSNIPHQLSLFYKPEYSNVKPNERSAEQRIKVYFQLLFSASPTTTTTRQISNKFPLNIKTPPVDVVDIFILVIIVITFQASFCIRYYLIAITALLSLSR